MSGDNKVGSPTPRHAATPTGLRSSHQTRAFRERERSRDWGTSLRLEAEPRPTPSLPSLTTRLDRLRKSLRPTPHVRLAMEGLDLFAKLEYVNPIGSIKDRAAYWILKRAAERGDIDDETTVIESSSGNFACALAAFTNLIGLRFIPVIDPNISDTYESFLRRICPEVVKVQERDDTGGFLKTRLQMVGCSSVAPAGRRSRRSSGMRRGWSGPSGPPCCLCARTAVRHISTRCSVRRG